MKALIVGILLICAGCVTCPAKDSYFLITDGYNTRTVLVKKGQFSMSDEERGFPVFDSYEELQKYLMKLYSDSAEVR